MPPSALDRGGAWFSRRPYFLRNRQSAFGGYPSALGVPSLLGRASRQAWRDVVPLDVAKRELTASTGEKSRLCGHMNRVASGDDAAGGVESILELELCDVAAVAKEWADVEALLEL